MAGIDPRFILIEAPAGSGKTTRISTDIEDYLARNQQQRVLCITYTNRAADELTSRLSSSRCDVSTIHSYFMSLTHSLFKQSKVVAYYLNNDEEFLKALEDLRSHSSDEKWRKRGERFAQKTGLPLSEANVRKHIEEHGLHYTQSSIRGPLYGGLNHDDLIRFISELRVPFPEITRRVTEKYSRIVIDEFQDTDIKVLEFFLAACTVSTTELHLWGDSMQQIYPTDIIRFNALKSQFTRAQFPITNYRSARTIVNVLNEIYGDPSLAQSPNSETNGVAEIHFTNSPDALKVELSATGGFLTLLLSHRERFNACGAGQLFSALSKLPQHKHPSSFTVNDALSTTDITDNENSVIQTLYGLLQLEAFEQTSHYGEIIQFLSRQPNPVGGITFKHHSDKRALLNDLHRVFTTMSNNGTISEVLEALISSDFIDTKQAEDIRSNNEYEGLLAIQFQQVRNAYNFVNAPTSSTQHGVKGEGHDKILLVAKDSTGIPNVRIYDLINYWTTHTVCPSRLERDFIEVKSCFESHLQAIGILPQRATLWDPELFEQCTQIARDIIEALGHNSLFNTFLKPQFLNCIDKRNHTECKDLFKLSKPEGILMAYKLFYVGCSRAKLTLHVILDRSKLSNIDKSRALFERLGFTVTDHEVES